MKISTQKRTHLGFNTSVATKLGVFSLSLLATASAVYLYSPVIGSHAEDSAAYAMEVENEYNSTRDYINEVGFSIRCIAK